MFRWLASSPKIYVVERQSPDWATLDDRYFDEMRAFARLIGRPENMMVDYVRLWDDTFPLSFFQVRARLKEIAMRQPRQHARGGTHRFGRRRHPRRTRRMAGV